MKIERYYYSENKAYWDSLLEETREGAEARIKAMEELSEEDREKVLSKQMEAVTELLSKLMPLPEEVCTVVNPSKYNKFLELADASAAFAEELFVNLLVFTEGLTGCISFVAEEFVCFSRQMEMFGELTAAADEIHIATSVDMGEGSPTDIDEGIRVEFWFDFYCQVETIEPKE